MGKMENEIASQLSCSHFKQVVKMQFDIIYIYIYYSCLLHVVDRLYLISNLRNMMFLVVKNKNIAYPFFIEIKYKS